MSEESRSGSETDENGENSSSDVQENVVTEYEKQRLERIKENRARLEALRLPSLASSLLNSLQKKGKGKRKGKETKEEDEEYKPSDGEERASSSSEEEGEEDEQLQEWSNKGKMRQSLNKSKSKKKVRVQKHVRKLDFIDDDEALQQAIALSLGDSSEISGAIPSDPPQNCRTDVDDVEFKENKGRALFQETDKRKKRRKSNTNRVQITEDQVIIHFFQFDDMGQKDIGRQHETLEGVGTRKFQCIYCGNILGGGCTTNLMQHLAACEHVPPHVEEEMRKHLSERESSPTYERVRKKRQTQAVRPQEEEEEDPELRLKQDIEEAMRRSMNDPDYKEMEEMKIAISESQRLNSHVLGRASSSRTPQLTMIIEDSDEELDHILGFC